ncbi:MAG: DUF6077 domain-containing protein [Myxococcota bacterium]|nr:DUF6077 domain-containing protein [Myxococcota bacterium]
MRSWLARSDRVCDAAVCGFAVWTLCCHAATFAGRSLDTLLWLFAGAIAVLATAAWRTHGEGPNPRPPAGGEDPSAPALWQRATVAAWALGCALGATLGAPLEVVWLAAAALTIGLSLRELLASQAGGDQSPPRETGVLWIAGLATLCAVVTLVAHRPDADDGFYLNLAVAAAENPGAPLLANDTLHRIPDVPLALPVYRTHSLELLHAALSRISGARILDVAHLWLPTLAALWVPFAFARLSRRILPRAWPAATGIAVAFLLFAGTASHGWANFGLVRLHQGKALLLTLLLPLTIAYALEFAHRGGARSWLRLAAVQIAAVGVSASSLWLAPAVSATALLAGVRSLREAASRTRLAAGVGASAYVLALALALRGATTAAFANAPIQSPELELSSLKLVTQALRTVIGPGLPGGFALFAALGAWAFAERPVTRRLCAFSAATTVLLWNPFAASFIAAHLTSAPTYWRILWLLPIPTMIAIVLTAPIERGLSAKPAAAIVTAAAILLFGASVVFTPKALAPSAANQVRIAAPGWKVPPSEFDAARTIAEAGSAADWALAPRLVAPWVPIFPDYPALLVVRVEYLPVLHTALGPEELTRRMRLMRLVSGDPRAAYAVEMLRTAILEDGLSIVCLANAAKRASGLMRVLAETGLQKIHANADYEVWKRSSTL